MPIDKRQTHSNIVKELMQSYKRTGKIGNTEPKDSADAERIANAIAYKTKKEAKDLALLTEMQNINQSEFKSEDAKVTYAVLPDGVDFDTSNVIVQEYDTEFDALANAKDGSNLVVKHVYLDKSISLRLDQPEDGDAWEEIIFSDSRGQRCVALDIADAAYYFLEGEKFTSSRFINLQEYPGDTSDTLVSMAIDDISSGNATNEDYEAVFKSATQTYSVVRRERISP